MIKDENEELLTDSNSILNRWKHYFSKLLKVHKEEDVREIEIQTAEPHITESTLLEVEIAIEKLTKYKFPGIGQIMQNSYRMTEIHYLLKSTDIHSTLSLLRRKFIRYRSTVYV